MGFLNKLHQLERFGGAVNSKGDTYKRRNNTDEIIWSEKAEYFKRHYFTFEIEYFTVVQTNELFFTYSLYDQIGCELLLRPFFTYPTRDLAFEAAENHIDRLFSLSTSVTEVASGKPEIDREYFKTN
jgi:hypothetical protein